MTFDEAKALYEKNYQSLKVLKVTHYYQWMFTFENANKEIEIRLRVGGSGDNIYLFEFWEHGFELLPFEEFIKEGTESERGDIKIVDVNEGKSFFVSFGCSNDSSSHYCRNIKQVKKIIEQPDSLLIRQKALCQK